MQTAREFWVSLNEYKQTHENWNMNDLITLLEARDELMRQKGYMQGMGGYQTMVDEGRL
jgi:hypothetical protein